MAIKFYKLMDILNRRGISRGELRELTGIAPGTMAKLVAGEYVALSVIDRICRALQVQPGDIMEYVDE